MAVDVCCEIASLVVVSPRISFSHDDGIPIECQQQQQQHYNRSDAFLLDSSTIDFDFCTVTDKQLLISSADELFSNGKILPFEFKKPTPFTEINQSLQKYPQSLQKQPEKSVLESTEKKKSLKEFLSTDLDDDDDEDDENQEKEKPPQPKPFWQFRRSSSLNYQNSHNTGFLQFLARSNSTGSAPIQKTPKTYQKQSSQIKVLRKSSSLSSSSTTSSSSSSSSSFSTNFSSFNQSHSSSKKGQSHPLKKSYSTRSYNGNGVHVSPVLNIPHGYISKGTVCLFGLAGSLFCNGKSKKKK